MCCSSLKQRFDSGAKKFGPDPFFKKIRFIHMINNLDIASIDFSKLNNGLVPAIVQDVETGTVLMLGFQNREACEKTLSDKKITFWSRTKQRLWTKGETSGNYLLVQNISLDCDNDSILYQVEAPQKTCHKGSFSCFGLAQNFCDLR
jgi:phosphoribosyl-AMP cyclohydrolase